MDVLKLIYDSIDEMNLGLNQSEQLQKNEATVIFGKASSLDSVDLISFIAIVEQKLEEETGHFFTIANEKTMTTELSPFQTVGSLKKYLESIVNEGKF